MNSILVRMNKIDRKKIIILFIFAMLSIFLLALTHIGKGQIYRGDDIYFHLSRIEGIAEGIRNGDYFPKIKYFFLYGMGYASPLFYSDLFFYPIGFLRFLGISISNSYILFLILINFVTYVTSYWSFNYYKKSKNQSFLFAIIYGSSAYRLSDLTERAAIGELLAFAFIPLAFVGLWTVLFYQTDRFYILSIGMALLILAHVLTAFIFSLFIFFYLMLKIELWIKNKEKMLSLVKSVVLTIFLCLGFLLPLVEQVSYQKLNFQTNQMIKLSESAGTVFQYIQTMIKNSGVNNLGISIVFFSGLLIFMYKKISEQSRTMLFLGIVFFVLSTNLFPHHFFDNTIMNSIQFPWRFFTIITFCICWSFADEAVKLFGNSYRKNTYLYVTIAFTLVFVLAHGLFIANKERYVTKEEFENIPQSFLGWGSEYLPSNMNINELVKEPTTIRKSPNISIKNPVFKYGSIDLDYDVRDKDSLGTIVLPLVHYKGYQATANGQIVNVSGSSNINGLSEVLVKGSGKLSISYRWTMIQVISTLVSLFSWLAIFVNILLSVRMKN